MPLDFGVSDMLVNEYDRFTRGLDALTHPERTAARRAMERARAQSPGRLTVTVPGLDDIYHFAPRPIPTTQERDEYWRARGAGQVPNLPENIAREIERRRDRKDAMRSDASPAYQQAFGDVLTAIDNVQDFLTTLALLGRLTVNPMLNGLEFLGGRFPGAFGRGVLGVASGLGRVVPVIGLILAAGAILNLLTLLGLMATPLYGSLCRGPRKALLNGVPSLLHGGALKSTLEGVASSNPFSASARLDRARQARSWKPTIGNLLEAAQTTDQLYGVGMSFGGLVGLVIGTTYAVKDVDRGAPVDIRFSPGARQLVEPLRRLSTGPRDSAVQDFRAAGHSLLGAYILSRTQEDFTVTEHLEALAAASAALSFLRPLIEAPEMTEAVELALEAEWAFPAPEEWHTLPLLQGAGEERGYRSTWPLPGNPETVKGRQLLDGALDVIPTAFRRLLLPLAETAEGWLLSALMMKFTERSAILLGGSPEAFRWEPTTDWRILSSLAGASLLVNANDGEEPVMRFWALATAWLHDHDAAKLPAPVIEELAQRADVGLIRLRPADWAINLTDFLPRETTAEPR